MKVECGRNAARSKSQQVVRLIMMLRQMLAIVLLSCTLAAQTSTGQQAEGTQTTAATPAQSPTTQDNGLAQMRDDLNKMESLNLNMSSETEFLRDQNLQILLRTNSQMWTILIRDLRRQLEREEQERAKEPFQPGTGTLAPKAQPSPR
jgi:hypothetical protein